MIEALKTEIARHGDQAAVVSIDRLHEIREDLEDLKRSATLNNLQQFIINDLYQLDAAQSGFEVRSIILVATPCPTTIELGFTRGGKRIPVILPASYVDKETAPPRITRYLEAYLQPRGYQVRYAPQLPRKRLAARSGLGVYGRNNLCYVEGMGSFINLTPFLSDIPCAEDAWQAVRAMDLCHACQACLQNCPTGAITTGSFLINNERCLTFFNEAGNEWNFPDWVDPSSHNALVGCLRCQVICPANKPYVRRSSITAEFSEEETAVLLEGKSFELLPEELAEKVKAFELTEYLGALPRNLRVLFNEKQA